VMLYNGANRSSGKGDQLHLSARPRALFLCRANEPAMTSRHRTGDNLALHSAADGDCVMHKVGITWPPLAIDDVGMPPQAWSFMLRYTMWNHWNELVFESLAPRHVHRG
jgi:hypothetical protein